MISIVYDVGKYRRILSEMVERNDVVIEVGPHIGKSTFSYLGRVKLAVLVDKGKQSEDVFKPMEDEFSQLRFVCGDSRCFSTVQEVLKITRECDVLAIDMGGGRFPDTVFKVWATWSGIFKPKRSLIRNRGLAEFVQRAKVLDDSVKKDFREDGWLSTWGRSVPYKLKKQLEEFRFWVDLD